MVVSLPSDDWGVKSRAAERVGTHLSSSTLRIWEVPQLREVSARLTPMLQRVFEE